MSSSVPRKGSLPFFSASMVNLTDAWALLRVCKKVLVVAKLSITVSVSSTYQL